MRIDLSMTLPREAASVPLARHTISAAITSAGVVRDCVHEVELALTEACANVLQHAQHGPEYEISISIVDSQMTIEIIDTGVGFSDPAILSGAMPHPHAESGRGVALMKVFADHVVFDEVTNGGGAVRLTKRLRWNANSRRVLHLGEDTPQQVERRATARERERVEEVHDGVAHVLRLTDGRDPDASLRDIEEGTAKRDRAGRERDKAASARDVAADRRAPDGEATFGDADQRDRDADRRDFAYLMRIGGDDLWTSTLQLLLERADRRHRLAEFRDRAAEQRDAAARVRGYDPEAERRDRAAAAIDRDNSGRDRDAAAADRAELIAAVRSVLELAHRRPTDD